MSQNKTRFPGMENAANNPYNRDMFAPNGDDEMKRNDSKATRFPGVEGVDAAQQTEIPHDPIVGFLFSVSKTPFGEYWPLYIGKNTIGRNTTDSANMINLLEGSVSNEHAALVIEQYTNPNETVAVLENKGSKNGTFINGKRVIYGRTEECKNGDILRFGSSYECMLILFDVRELGLKKAENFISVEAVESSDPWDEGNDSPYKPNRQDAPYFDPSSTSKATNAMNGEPMFGGNKHKTEAM